LVEPEPTAAAVPISESGEPEVIGRPKAEEVVEEQPKAKEKEKK